MRTDSQRHDLSVMRERHKKPLSRRARHSINWCSIEKHLRKEPGITKCSVALLAQKADIEFDESQISAEKIANMIDEIGFEASLPLDKDEKSIVDLNIEGMTCASCSGTIERELGKTHGIKSASVNLLGQSGRFEYDKNQVGIRDIIDKIESLGFGASLKEETGNAELEALERKQEIAKWKSAFYSSVLFAIPVIFISMFLPMISPGALTSEVVKGLPLDELIMLLLTVPVQFGVGKIYYQAAHKSLKHGTYTMV
jgi:Cu+-exporting ATPase